MTGFVGLRMAGLIPGFIIAFFIYDLGTIFDWAGLMSFLGVIVAVPLLWLGTKLLYNEPSPYENIWTQPVYAWIIVVIGIVFFLLNLTLLIKESVEVL